MIVTASSSENKNRPPGRPCITWLNTVQWNLRADNLTLNEAVNLAHNCPSVQANVYVWHYALLLVHARKEEEEEDSQFPFNQSIFQYTSSSDYLRCLMFGTMHRWGTRTIFGVPVVPDVVITYASRRAPKPGALDAHLADDSSETRPTISSFNSSNSCTTILPQSTSLSASTNFTNTYAYQCYKVVRLLRRKNVNICTCITVMAIFWEKLG